MKTLAILLAVLSACVDQPCPDPVQPPPVEYPPATYCGVTIDHVDPQPELFGPCSITVSIEMMCTQHDVEAQAFDTMHVAWQVENPAPVPYDAGLVDVTYQCNAVAEITLYKTACAGTPVSVIAAFQQPVTGEYETPNGRYLCAAKETL